MQNDSKNSDSEIGVVMKLSAQEKWNDGIKDLKKEIPQVSMNSLPMSSKLEMY
jgi:hypothetical protein